MVPPGQCQLDPHLGGRRKKTNLEEIHFLKGGRWEVPETTTLEQQVER